MEFDHNNNYVVTTTLCVVLLVLQQYHSAGLVYAAASTTQPAAANSVRALMELNPATRPAVRMRNYKPKPPAASIGFHMKMEDSHNRPTTPGNSPGMGHNNPPGGQA